MAGPLVGLGDGGCGQAQGGDAGAGGQVAGYGEGLRRQGPQAHLAAPFVEKLPLGTVDAPGVVGEDGLQGVGTPWSAARRAGAAAGWLGTICGLLTTVVMDDSGRVIKGRRFRQLKAAR